jgi:hypothetical protein
MSVCTLPADGLGERLAWIRSEILPHAITHERKSNGIAWELDDSPGLVAKIDRLIALEKDCCSGIVFEHRPSPTAKGRRRLEVRGIDPRAAIVADLRVGPGQPRRAGSGLARAVGLGSMFSLFVCCAIPFVAAALFGATAAAPFASLDRPWVIASVAVVFGGAAFAWQRRRHRAGRASRS